MKNYIYIPMDWSTENVLTLIDAYKNQPVLWNILEPNFKNKEHKAMAWEKISERLGLDKNDVEKKMKNLIGQFWREIRTMHTMAEKGLNYQPKWQFFNFLIFLQNVPRPKTATFISSTHSREETRAEVNIWLICPCNRIEITTLVTRLS